MTTLGVIDVACDLHGAGKRLANRLLARFGGRPLLSWLIRRVTEAERLDQVVAVFPKSETQHFHLTHLVPNDVESLVADSSDPLKRLVAALDRFPHDAVVRIGMDSPFVDPLLIDLLVDSAAGCPLTDYASFRRRDGNPAIQSHVGLFAEWCSATALRKADRLVDRSDERRQLTRYFFAHAEQFQLRLIPVPYGIDRDEARLCIDEPEDWELAEDIFEALGEDGLNCYNLGELVNANSAVRARMEALNQTQIV